MGCLWWRIARRPMGQNMRGGMWAALGNWGASAFIPAKTSMLLAKGAASPVRKRHITGI